MTKYRNPSLGYPGGKSKVASKIIAKMPPHETYVEPFAGAAHIFFRKSKAKKNVLNDKNKELIKFFKQVKGKQICCAIDDSNRKKFSRLKKKSSLSACDFLFLNKTSYGGVGGFANRKKKTVKKHCIDGSKLKGVILSTNDFRKTINKHDSKDTLFYIDPPYAGLSQKKCESIYGKDRCEVTPEDVAKAVKNIKGKAIISYDNHKEVRKTFKGCKIKKIELPYSIARNKDKVTKGKTKELLITDC